MWAEVLQWFLYWKQAQGVSERTLSNYRLHVDMFFKRYGGCWQSNTMRKCVLEYMADKIKPATYNLRLVYLRAFFQWCVEEGYIPQNPMKGFKRRKAPGRVVAVTADTLRELLCLPDQNTFAGLRDSMH